jgi:hypothetical protein
MRKGEKLFKYIMEKIENMEGDPTLSPSANDARDLWFGLQYLELMDDNVFDEIIGKPELDKDEILCTLCKNVTWCNPKFPMDKEEMENYICSSCEQAVNEKRFY